MFRVSSCACPDVRRKMPIKQCFHRGPRDRNRPKYSRNHNLGDQGRSRNSPGSTRPNCAARLGNVLASQSYQPTLKLVVPCLLVPQVKVTSTYNRPFAKNLVVHWESGNRFLVRLRARRSLVGIFENVPFQHSSRGDIELDKARPTKRVSASETSCFSCWVIMRICKSCHKEMPRNVLFEKKGLGNNLAKLLGRSA